MRFLRYPGGKGKLLSVLVNYLPKTKDLQGKYIEPFVGGGAVFLYLSHAETIIADLNSELIDLYKGVKRYPHKVWEIFESFPSGRKGYYKVRDDLARREHICYRAARTLYLNRTCFKGMWRHNPQGNFNVGYGGEERRWAVTHESMVELSQKLKKTKIIQADFDESGSGLQTCI
jgi:DNA adenine methylase